jgi:protein SCO1
MRPWHAAPLALLALRALAGPPAVDPSDSVYQLKASLTAQDGRQIGLDVYRGQPVLVTMFYASCQATCPLIVDTLRKIEKQAPPEQRTQLRVLLISLDPDKDTPAALAEVARTRHVDTSRWTLAHADEATVRKIAALLDVQYRKLPDGEFNHGTVIALLSPRGEIEARTTALGQADARILEKLGAAPR